MGEDVTVPTIILRSRAARIGTLLLALVTLYPVAVLWLADGYGSGLSALAVAAAVDVGLWLLWWRPEARLETGVLTVRNAWRTHVVAWEAVRAAEARWGLVLHVAGGTDQRVGSDVADASVARDAAGAIDGACVTGAADAGGRADPGAAPERRVSVSACQRGGVLASLRRERRAPAAPQEYVTPVEDPAVAVPVYRRHLDAADAAYLVELYRTVRADHLASPSARLRGSGSEALTPPYVARWDAAPLAVAGIVVVGLVLTTTLL